MKRVVLIFSLVFLFTSLVLAQAPLQMNFQGMARNAKGESLINQNIHVRISIHDNSATGSIAYSETRVATTNAVGVFNIVIGSAGATGSSGSLDAVKWESGKKFLQFEFDADGNNNFIDLGTTQLQSVPYALNAYTAMPIGIAGGDLSGTYPKPSIANNAVTTLKIADFSVTDVKIESISGSKVVGNIGGNAANVTGVVSIANGGTGANTLAGIKSSFGFGSVDNTRDLDKPISTFTQLALDNKLNAADTSAMLNPYAKSASTLVSLNSKVNIADTASMLNPYAKYASTLASLNSKVNIADTASMLNPYAKSASTLASLNSKVNIADTASMLNPYAKSASTLASLNSKVNIADTASMLNPYAKSASTLASLNIKVNIADTASMLSPYAKSASTLASLNSKVNIADTASMLNPYAKQASTLASLNSKVNIADTATMLNAYAKSASTLASLNNKVNIADTASMLNAYAKSASTLASLNSKVNIADTASMLNAYAKSASTLASLNSKVNIADTASMLNAYAKSASTLASLNNKVNIADTASMLNPYAKSASTLVSLNSKVNIADTATMLNPYAKQASTLASLNSKVNIADTASMLNPYAKSASINLSLSAKAPLESPTFTGNLSGTSASFTGNLTSGKFILGTDLSMIPVDGGQSVLSSWHGLQLVGNKQSDVVDYTPINIGENTDFSVIVPNQQAGSIGLIVKGQTSQTGNLLEFRDIDNTGLSAFDADGNLALGKTSASEKLDITGNIKSSGYTLSSGFKTPTGTSSEYLMADGSVSAGSSAIREVADEFTATASQTSFTLTQTPSANSKVKMYINGIRISNTAYSYSDTTLTYVPANNGAYALSADDRIQFDYYY